MFSISMSNKKNDFGEIHSHLWLGGFDHDYIRETYASKNMSNFEVESLINWCPLEPDAT
jgi:hypothetical protein